MTPLELLVACFLILGSLVALLTSIGLLRFGDVFLRMHASSKTATLGLWFIMLGTALYFGEALITIKLIALLAIYFFTAPTGTQVLARAAHISGAPKVKQTWIDDLEAYNREQNSAAEPLVADE
jgi:multicomponent Na+:H+ antiporter subunit G